MNIPDLWFSQGDTAAHRITRCLDAYLQRREPVEADGIAVQNGQFYMVTLPDSRAFMIWNDAKAWYCSDMNDEAKRAFAGNTLLEACVYCTKPGQVLYGHGHGYKHTAPPLSH